MGTFMNFDFLIFAQRQTTNFILCTKCYGVIGLVYVVKRVLLNFGQNVHVNM